MATYYAIAPEDGLAYLRARASGEGGPHIEDIRRLVGPGERVDERYALLRRRLLELRKEFPATLRRRDPEGGRFDSQACAIVHERLADIGLNALADQGFWIWLALDCLAEIGEWRYGSQGPVEAKNYGIGSRTENFVFRLWLRGDIGRGEGRDPYELARIGDQDLWRSHILRQGYASARSICVALLRLQAGRLKRGGRPARKLASGDDPAGVRLLAKRLRRLRPNLILESLSAAQAEALVLELSADLRTSR